MSDLIVLFLLIAVLYLVIVERKNVVIEQVILLYEDLREELYQNLLVEFGEDLPLKIYLYGVHNLATTSA